MPNRLAPEDATTDGEELPSRTGLRGLDRRYVVGFVAGALAGVAIGLPGAYAVSKLSPEVPARAASQRAPGSKSKSWIDQGLRALADKSPERALHAFQKAARLDPKNADIHNNVCVAFNELRRYADAVVACKQALALRHDFSLAQNNLSWAEFQLAQAQASIRPGASP